MFKAIALLTALIATFYVVMPAYSEEEFNSEIPQLTDNPRAFSAVQTANNDVINRTLGNYRRAAYVEYASASSLTVTAGEVACNSNTGATNGQAVIYRQNTSGVTANVANLDTGNSFNASTTYYVYADCDAAATTFTVVLSLNGSTPTGITNYVQMGTFATDSSSNITAVVDSSVSVKVGAVTTSYSVGPPTWPPRTPC